MSIKWIGPVLALFAIAMIMFVGAVVSESDNVSKVCQDHLQADTE